jgi:hypothetical protein
MQPLYLPENAVPPNEVRFEDIDIEPLPEDRKVRVRIGITPFTSPPNLRVQITGPDGSTAARIDIIETINHRMKFTMHVRSAPAPGEYILTAEIYYPDLDPVDRRIMPFSIIKSAHDE